VCLGTGTSTHAEEPGPLLPGQVEFFEQRIRPVLVAHCYECHSAEAKEVQGGLLLDNRAALTQGGNSGTALVPGKPEASRLIVALSYQDENLQMPPAGKLPDEVLADFEQWVRAGAPDPRSGAAPKPVDNIAARAREHWAFQLPGKPELPAVRQTDWPRAEIDNFVLARLEQQGIEPSPTADARTRIRRLYYDLIGLPPTFEQVQAFTVDSSAAAYERLVDELLQSKHFGERWARHWLDVSRFGDTKGYVFQEDRNYKSAYKYRDWVIRAFNDDLPYDRFLQYQIAADQLVGDAEREQLAALGYLTLGRRFLNNKHDLIDDRLDVVFRGLMGLTIGCARCHDHKYDPLPTRDYYSLYGVFASSREQQDEDLPLRLMDRDNPEDARIFIRGSSQNQGDVAPRQYLSFFSKAPQPFRQGSGRLELAQAITSRDNPLTARVFVNRVWGHLFGEELVRTPSDFGLRSDPPTHQAVLDWLAVSFMEDGWSVKRLIRRIALSQVYQQQSHLRDEAARIDPENLLLWRAQRRRLDFEALRDSLLAVSGKLDTTVGGESVKIVGPAPSPRRTVYAFIDRQNLPGVFRTFDFASPDTHSPKRPKTTVPQQALYLLNNAFVQEVAAATVQRVADAEPVDARVTQLYRLILAREPTRDELQWGREFVAATSTAEPVSPDGQSWGVWERYAQTLMLTNDFMFLD